MINETKHVIFRRVIMGETNQILDHRLNVRKKLIMVSSSAMMENSTTSKVLYILMINVNSVFSEEILPKDVGTHRKSLLSTWPT